MSNRFAWRLMLTALSLGVLFRATADEPRKETGGKPSWEKILEWLPENTVTIIVSQKPFKIPPGGPKLLSAREEMHMLPVIPLMQFLPEVPAKELFNQEIIYAVEGSRDFAPPKNFGPARYKGCHILQFDAAAANALRKAFQTCLKNAPKKIQIAEQDVAVYTQKIREDAWTCYIAQPQSGFLLLATDQEYLETTLKRMAVKNQKRALPKDLPEWKHVNVNAPVWAVLHSHQDTPKKGNSADADEGFVFWYDSGKTLHARCFAMEKDDFKELKMMWVDPEEKGFDAIVKDLGKGVASIEVTINKNKKATILFFVVLSYLGHPVII